MSKANTGIDYPSTDKEIIIIVGGFGSGKTEVSVNLAKYFYSSNSDSVTLVDLDLVNPYFRTREAKEELESLGVKLIAPEGGKFYADLPILLPQVRGLIDNHEGLLIIDVGGDLQGTKALGSIANLFQNDSYEMLIVLNSRRPQTSEVETSIQTLNRVEMTSGLKFTGLISNTHMIDETDVEIVMEGYEMACKVSDKTGLPIFLISAKEEVVKNLNLDLIKSPVLPLTRSLLKPWERKK